MGRIANAAKRGASATAKGTARSMGRLAKRTLEAGYRRSAAERCPHCGGESRVARARCPHCGRLKH